MRGSLGEKIGEGASADVHAWAPGQAVKLFKAGVSAEVAWYEARMTRAAFAAGLPAPEVFGEVTVEGRSGIVLSRFDGPTLRDLSRTGAIGPAEAGAILAALAIAVHGTAPPPEALSLRAYMESAVRLAGARLPESFANGVLTLIDRLPAADTLCHCDLHPGNVIMAEQGPRLVDWTGLVRGPAAYDLAVSHIILSELVASLVDDPERPRAVDAAALADYARLAGLSPAALGAAMEPCLPIVCVSILLGGAAPARRPWLIQRVEAALAAAG